MNWVHILPVKLPGISVPVLCWPATLTLNANLPVSQPAGNYRGQLTVVFTLST
ncbi:CfaE/CblD family pilus tip adhesin [Escherichia coli]|uniref:CfaE/CblD family pilus tip adhesin n=1 Tax=Escherichia coli TaxID=562 RepID=UPI0037C068E2